MVMLVLVLACMVTDSVLIIGQGWLGWTDMRECWRYVLDVCMGGACVLCI